jgi:hypothetical protein
MDERITNQQDTLFSVNQPTLKIIFLHFEGVQCQRGRVKVTVQAQY